MPIHPTAVVDPRAEISPLAEIGPYAVIDGPVTIGDRTRIFWHATVMGRTTIGADCQVYPHALVGGDPQDLSFDGRETRCSVGDGTVIRESVTIHRGTTTEHGTVIGRKCFIMATAHVAHDCVLGDEVKMVNASLLAGHVQVGNGAFLAGGASVHQFSRIGELAMLGGNSSIHMDVPPFFTAVRLGRCSGINAVGLRRAGFTLQERNELRTAYRLLYRSGLTFTHALERLAPQMTTPPGLRLLHFLQAPSKRGICAAIGREQPGAE